MADDRISAATLLDPKICMLHAAEDACRGLSAHLHCTPAVCMPRGDDRCEGARRSMYINRRQSTVCMAVAACWNGVWVLEHHTPSPACGEAPQGRGETVAATANSSQCGSFGRPPCPRSRPCLALAISRSELEGRAGDSTCEIARGNALDLQGMVTGQHGQHGQHGWTFVDSPSVVPQIEGRGPARPA